MTRVWLLRQPESAAPDVFHGAESDIDLSPHLTDELAGERLVIVAHGVVCRVLLLSLLSQWTVADWMKVGPIRNVGITELQGSGATWGLIRFNEVPRSVEEVGD